jgi:hypothetical protein
MDAARLDFCQMHEQRRQQLIGLADQAPRIRQELVICQLRQTRSAAGSELSQNLAIHTGYCRHVPLYTRDFEAQRRRAAMLLRPE